MQQINQVGQNPNLMTQIMNNNPEIANTLNSYNGDGKAAFYDKARSMGYQDQEINEFVNKLYALIGSKL